MRRCDGDCNASPAVVLANHQVQAAPPSAIPHENMLVLENLDDLPGRQPMTGELLLIIVVNEQVVYTGRP